MKKNSEQNKTGVLLEDLDSKLDTVLDGLRGVDKRIEKNHEEFGAFEKEVDYKFEAVLDELRVIRNELKEKIGREEFILLEKRVLRLEKGIKTHN